MNNILVLYQSKYGATKKYVEMLEKDINCDIFEINNFDFKNIHNYDFILFAGGIYASGISIIKYVQKNMTLLIHKKVAIFSVGASPYDETAFETVKEHNLKNISFDIPVFYGRGTYDESIMNFVDKSLCRLLKKSIRKKDASSLEPWMKALLEADGKSCCWIDQIYLEPVIQYIHQSLAN